ncbi:MAG: hypothetical protein AB1716_11605 [Planctomycetota bacterium]
MKALPFGLFVIGLAIPVLAQVEPPPPPPPDAVVMRSDVPPDGFWPTPRMLDRIVDRMTDEMAELYNFNGEQLDATRAIIKQRFPEWLQQNRTQIQPLINEYVEALLGGEPPAADEVADWALRAQPLVGEFRALIQQTTDELRTFMTPEQEVLLNGQLAAMDVGMNFMQQRLDVWAHGGYDPEVDWHRSPDFREKQRERERQLKMQAEIAKEAAMGVQSSTAQPQPGAAAGPPKPAGRSPLDATATDDWVAYVEAFIRRYELNDAQQNRAREILRVKQTEKDKYLRTKADDIQRIDGLSKRATTDEQRAQVAEELQRVRQPLERMFQDLKDRLDRLPTPSQKRAVLKLEDGRSRKTGGEAPTRPAEAATTAPTAGGAGAPTPD